MEDARYRWDAVGGGEKDMLLRALLESNRAARTRLGTNMKDCESLLLEFLVLADSE